MTIIHTTDSTFDQDVLESSKPILVDFWADWCNPCKRIAPILAEIAEEQSECTICKIDIVDNPKTMERFDVKGLPSLLLFHNGKIIARKVGALSKNQILEFLSQANAETAE
ncbi:thioredoxin [Candidatus Synchoanobacter obligatus]|uniref:Thioredoxin n=1 Tax=Candidatus Synchoanobacter obligatus TaxID=2919597 RepID=A0ABT1L512_9GAMM|nr:thioredoxin [Candidatus Synchoanobacter obligatus]MCP8352262.1 thioredoxin [Candidatus Synchoanobacter obligatus]